MIKKFKWPLNSRDFNGNFCFAQAKAYNKWLSRSRLCPPPWIRRTTTLPKTYKKEVNGMLQNKDLVTIVTETSAHTTFVILTNINPNPPTTVYLSCYCFAVIINYENKKSRKRFQDKKEWICDFKIFFRLKKEKGKDVFRIL